MLTVMPIPLHVLRRQRADDLLAALLLRRFILLRQQQHELLAAKATGHQLLLSAEIGPHRRQHLVPIS